MQKVIFKISVLSMMLFFIMSSSCTTKECEDENEIIHFEQQVRPTVTIMNGNLGVPNLDISVKVYKEYCDGSIGSSEWIEGKTNGAGIYESPGSWTLKITSGIDKATVTVSVSDGDWIGACTYEYDEFSSSSYFQPNCILQYNP